MPRKLVASSWACLVQGIRCRIVMSTFALENEDADPSGIWRIRSCGASACSLLTYVNYLRYSLSREPMASLVASLFKSGSAPADICIVGGAGHVGLPLSVVFAIKGQRVVIYDKDRQALATIGQGKVPFMEQGAEPLLKDILAKGLLGVSDNPDGIKGVPAIIITIGTPVDEFLNPDLKVIRKCVDELLPFLSNGQLVILRSTVCPGTTEWLAKYLASKGKHVHVSFCPERVVQGHAIEELQIFPQIVSGVTPEAEAASAKLFELIAPCLVRLAPVEAEFAKLFSNAWRYMQFAIANQFYMMTTSAGIDYYRVLEGAKKDYARMSDLAGAGFAAGPCLFKDVMQLVAFSNNQFSLGQAAMLVNEGLPQFIVDRILRKYNLESLTVGLLGMAFKADSDDPRASVSYKLKKILAFRAKSVLTTDPHVRGDPEILPLEEVISRSDILVLCVPHSAYRVLNVEGKIVLDIWNFWGKGGSV